MDDLLDRWKTSPKRVVLLRVRLSLEPLRRRFSQVATDLPLLVVFDPRLLLLVSCEVQLLVRAVVVSLCLTFAIHLARRRKELLLRLLVGLRQSAVSREVERILGTDEGCSLWRVVLSLLHHSAVAL